MILGIDASRANHTQKSGVEWYAFFVIQELKKIIPQSWQVILYTDIKLEGEIAELPQNWTQKVLKWPPRRLWTQLRLSIEMIQRPPDILFIPAHVPPLLHPKRTIMVVHDVAAIHFPQSYNHFERWYSVVSARYAVKNLPAVIVPCQFTKNDLLKLEPKINSDKIKIIHLGVNPIFLDKSILNCHSDESQNPGPKDKNYLLYIGRLEEKKNTKRLVEAFTLAKQKGLTQRLILVGKPGHGYEAVKEAIDKSSARDSIQQIPWLAENELVSIMRGASLFVFPSLFEGFGLPILEAFAAGVPVLTSTAGSLPEIGGDAAEYVDPLDVDAIAAGMIELTQNNHRREELIAKGLQRVQEFSWKKTAEETFAVFKNLICS